MKNTCHSTGAVYATVCNNPRSIQYLAEETYLIYVFPGPYEPTLTQLNNVLVPAINNAKILYNGEGLITCCCDLADILYRCFTTRSRRNQQANLSCTNQHRCFRPSSSPQNKRFQVLYVKILHVYAMRRPIFQLGKPFSI